MGDGLKIFISWSGARSRAVAELMSDWIKCVLQASQPWISTRDIDKGAIWFSEISDQLKDTAAGIVCLTRENKDKPWILFETGALAKGLSTNRVCTFLVDLNASDVEDPLAQFNHTTPDQSSLWGLTCSLNNCLGDRGLEERILKQVFDTYWPKFYEGFNKAIEGNPPGEKVEPRSDQSILSEILSNTRMLASRVRDLEGRLDGTGSGHGRIDVKDSEDVVKGAIDRLIAGISPEEIVQELRREGYSLSSAKNIIGTAYAVHEGSKNKDFKRNIKFSKTHEG